MPEVGLRELKTRASEILRDVRDRHARYIITYRGRPVGLLAPLAEAGPQDRGSGSAWEELERLGEEIGRGWCSPLSSTEILSQMRR
jgi:prevent-host-death family protein